MTQLNALQHAIKDLAFHRPLDADEVGAAFDVIMQGEGTAVQIASFLTGLRVMGETADTVAGAARALRRAMIRLPVTDADDLVDTCGTGGGAVTTFNISTAAAFVAAGAGVRIAKHGNRSFTSSCGSADVLEALGVRIEAPLEVMTRSLEEAGIVFMFAPAMHPAMKHVGPVRRELAIPTVMNIVGPLANPAGVGRQLVGVADRDRMGILASALLKLGSVHALVVYGEPGLDEISPLGTTHVAEIKDGVLTEWTIEPAKHGIGKVSPNDLGGGSPADNAHLILDLLAGGGTPGAKAAVELNAAAAVYLSGKAGSFFEGVTRARDALRAGSGLTALEKLRAVYS
ncbi:MAG TPA: anthranilate phosphoribosyltransferase [Gemmatimonadaceae bacterium]|nr:anthranilate phosphoribosyltransferase [Gemmatimonadaceae bacterium]